MPTSNDVKLNDPGAEALNLAQQLVGALLPEQSLPLASTFTRTVGINPEGHLARKNGDVYTVDETVARTFKSITDFGGRPTNSAAENDIAFALAEASSFAVIFLPAGEYLTTRTPYQLTSKVYYGLGKIRMIDGGQPYSQALTRGMLLVDPGDAPAPRVRVFDGAPPQMQEQRYSYIGSAVGSVEGVTYRTITRAAQSLRIIDNAGGHNTLLNNQSGGRTGIIGEILKAYQGGQGDLVGRAFHGSVYSTKPGMTHFLAGPGISAENGGLEATGSATGAYLQHSEYTYKDNGLAVSAIDAVRSYQRTNSGRALSQTWEHDRPSSVGTVPADIVYHPMGSWEKVLDLTGTTLTADKSAILFKADDRIYWQASAAVDAIGFKGGASTYTFNDTYTYGGSDGVLHNVVNGIDLAMDPTAWATPALTSPWIGFTTNGQSVPKYRRDGFGKVLLKGEAYLGSNSTNMFTLPAGFRPPEDLYFATRTAYGASGVKVAASGQVIVTTTASDGANNHASLDGISFSLT